MKKSAHNDFIDKDLDNVRFMKLNSYPATSKQATAKYYVDQSINGSTLIRNDKINDLTILLSEKICKNF